jgi:hypothetical protein
MGKKDIFTKKPEYTQSGQQFPASVAGSGQKYPKKIDTFLAL